MVDALNQLGEETSETAENTIRVNIIIDLLNFFLNKQVFRLNDVISYLEST